MAFFKRKTPPPISVFASKKSPHSEGFKSKERWRWRLIQWILFGGMAGLLVWSQAIFYPQIFLNHTSPVHLVATVGYEYLSKVQTDALKEQRRQMVIPVYSVDMDRFQRFSQKIQSLKAWLTTYGQKSASEQGQALKALRTTLQEKEHFYVDASDMRVLLAIQPEWQRNRLFDECLFLLQEVVQRGIIDDADVQQSKLAALFDRTYDEKTFTYLNSSDALKMLRTNLFALSVPYEQANAMVHILKQGLQSNIVYDQQRTLIQKEQFVELTPSVRVTVKAGDLIVEQGQRVTPAIYESYEAYIKALLHQDFYHIFQIENLIQKIFILALCTAIWGLILRSIPTRLNRSNRFRTVTIGILLANAMLLLGIKYMCHYSAIGQQYQLATCVSWLTPTFLTAMLLTPFADVYAGWMSTLYIIALKHLMFDGSLAVLMVDLLVGTVLVHKCRKFKFRKDILRATVYGFALYAAVSLAYDALLAKHFDAQQVEKQMAAIGINALATVSIAFLLLPFLEKRFHFTLNLTFLNLTNYNHPLLRELQESAPGTYSHSLMVAVLAENAAHEIGASPTLCRCCSLYHDIGKTLKPAYFTENQQNGINPHKDYPPTMSAAILKSHITYGVELAQRFKLPQAIIDVIQQHHGTSLMQYFYKKAQLLKKEGETIDEKLFRYDGPTPTFRESAIISLADALEAASRSLEEVTPQSVEALVAKIVHGRMEEEQLRDCPLTLKELDIVCKNFQTTLLNMYHSRVRYDKIEVGAMASTRLDAKTA